MAELAAPSKTTCKIGPPPKGFGINDVKAHMVENFTREKLSRAFEDFSLELLRVALREKKETTIKMPCSKCFKNHQRQNCGKALSPADYQTSIFLNEKIENVKARLKIKGEDFIESVPSEHYFNYECVYCLGGNNYCLSNLEVRQLRGEIDAKEVKK